MGNQVIQLCIVQK